MFIDSYYYTPPHTRFLWGVYFPIIIPVILHALRVEVAGLDEVCSVTWYNGSFSILIVWLRSEEEGDDEVDSDFSIEENDEPKSDTENNEDAKKRQKKGVFTKSYKVLQ